MEFELRGAGLKLARTPGQGRTKPDICPVSDLIPGQTRTHLFRGVRCPGGTVSGGSVRGGANAIPGFTRIRKRCWTWRAEISGRWRQDRTAIHWTYITKAYPELARFGAGAVPIFQDAQWPVDDAGVGSRPTAARRPPRLLARKQSFTFPHDSAFMQLSLNGQQPFVVIPSTIAKQTEYSLPVDSSPPWIANRAPIDTAGRHGQAMGLDEARHCDGVVPDQRRNARVNTLASAKCRLCAIAMSGIDVSLNS